MSVAGYVVLIGFFVACALAIWVLIRLASRRGAPNRERIERIRVQGNFVPLTPADLAEDERRNALHASGKGGL